MAPACVMMADMGMVLMMVVVPGLVVLGDTLLMPRMVGLVPAPLACVVVMMVVGLPSAEVTSFRMVPAGRGPLVCEGKQVEEGEVDRQPGRSYSPPQPKQLWASSAHCGGQDRAVEFSVRHVLNRPSLGRDTKFHLLASPSLGPTSSPG